MKSCGVPDLSFTGASTGVPVVFTAAVVVLSIARVVLRVLGAVVVVMAALVVLKESLLVFGVVLSTLNTGLVVVIFTGVVKARMEASRAAGLTLLSLELWKVKGDRWSWELCLRRDAGRLWRDFFRRTYNFKKKKANLLKLGNGSGSGRGEPVVGEGGTE